MPYTGQGPYPVGSLENDIIDALWAGNPPQAPDPAEQARAYVELQMTDFNGGAVAAAPSFSLGQWIEQNKTAVYIGAGVLVAMSLLKR